MSPGGFKLLTSAGKAVKTLSRSLRRQPQNVHLPTPPPFFTVPFDIIEEILLHLPGQDIIKMRQVR